MSKLNPFRWGKKDANAATTGDSPATAHSSQLDDPAVRKKLFNSAMSKSITPRLESSIFEDEITEGSEKTDAGHGMEQQVWPKPRPEDLVRVKDPNPRSRQRWERKMVIQMVKRNGRETRRDIVERTERQMSAESERLPTSIKKLVHLARQIQGKSVDDALLQMQYSKKKMAKEVKHTLEEARDNAIVTYGMGLGKAAEEGKAVKPRKIQTKDGKWMVVRDPTRMYVAEAWVGKSQLRGKRAVRMGRGRKGLLRSPTTKLYMVLKEEKTRIRQYDERKLKEYNQGPWVHLPDRPVTAQRQHYSW